MASASHLAFALLHPKTLFPFSPLPSGHRAHHLTAFRHLPVRPTRLRAVSGGGGGGLGDLGDVIGRIESLVYVIADAAVSSSAAVEESAAQQQSGDWFSGITGYMEAVLKVLKDGLSALHVPYAYGFAIILLTVFVKAATFPLTKKQVESALAMKSLQPQVKAIQQRYAGDQERIQLEIARLYKLAGINPLAGCLPTLLTIPVWIGLYRALSNVADEGLLTEGFFWIPSLAGPTTIAARQSGSGISWLFPFKDGHPPLGWSDTFAYLVLPTLLVISQFISAQIMQQSQGNDPNQKTAQAITKFLPLLIGYFALSVPSGLSLYWLTNNILSTGQQVWLQKLGGAKNPVKDYFDKVAKDEPPNSDKYSSNVDESISDREADKERASEEPISGGTRRGERFRQMKEEEARRKMLKKETEGSQQDTAKDQKNMELLVNNNGGVSQNNDRITDRNLNGTALQEEVTETHASLGNQASTDTPNLRDQQDERDES